MYTPTECNCPIQQVLLNQESYALIRITAAEKRQVDISKTNSSTFTVYTIVINECNIKVAKRRYSEFESFRKSLVKLYPALLIPPIPEKHSLTDYTSQKQKDDSLIVEKRKRMLERFLQRLAVHPVLGQEHVFHRFLDGDHTWSDILCSAPLSNLPKDPLLPSEQSFAKSITNNLPTAVGVTPVTNGTNVIPIPSSSYTLKFPDQEFQESETKVGKSAQQTSFQFEKSQKRILRRLSDLANDFAELGSVYNALSLNETAATATSIEKISQIIEGSCTTTKEMVKSLEVDFSEHVQDYTQYVSIAKDVLKYRHMKQAQLELIEEAIDHKKALLRSLIKTEDESQKLKSTMDQLSLENPVQRPVTITTKKQQHENQVLTSDDDDDDNSSESWVDDVDTQSIEDGFSAVTKSSSNGIVDNTDENGPNETMNTTSTMDYPTNASAPVLRASKNQTKRWSSPRKLFSAVSYTIQGMIDADPGQTRRNQIAKLKENIDQLEQARLSTRQELKDMSTSIQQDFDRLQIQKEKELKSILISFAKIHVLYCEQNAAFWREIRTDVVVSMENL